MNAMIPKRERSVDEEENDEKMDKFYELIRKFNETRSRCGIIHPPVSGKQEEEQGNNKVSSSQEKEVEDEEKEKVEDNDPLLIRRPTSWKPCFKWEDFHQPYYYYFHHQNYCYYYSYKKRKTTIIPSPPLPANNHDQDESSPSHSDNSHLDLNNLPL